MQHQSREPSVAERYQQMGQAYITRQKSIGKDPCQAIRPNDPEWRAWERYFLDHLRWRPAVMRMVLNGSVPSMTVPCQWPEWLDSSYQSEAA